MGGLREHIMAQCTGRMVRVNLPAAGASQQILPGSAQRVAVSFLPSSIVAAFRTEPLTSAADGIAPQAGWTIPITFDLWTHGQLCQAPWYCWAIMTGYAYCIEVTYPGRLDLPEMINRTAKMGTV